MATHGTLISVNGRKNSDTQSSLSQYVFKFRQLAHKDSFMGSNQPSEYSSSVPRYQHEWYRTLKS